ncbi:MAG: TIGR02281 family clan AA aspartic protease [Pseudomonadota bacterium]
MARILIAFLGVCAVLAPAALAQGVEQVELDRTGPQAVKLVALLAFFLFILFTARRLRVPQMLKSAAIWLVALLALVAVYAYRAPLEIAGREMVSVLVPGVAITAGDQVIVRRSRNSQFLLNGSVNGTRTDFLFDTGASLVVLSAADAQNAGFHPETLNYRIPVMTAAGMTEVAPVRLRELSVGGIVMNEVRAAIAKPGDLDTSLLGMTFLNRLDGYEVRRDRLVLNP